MDSSKGGSPSKPGGGGGSGDDEYDKKFQELQKHIPFLKGMMRKLEHSSDKLRAAQLNKMKNLYSLLTHPQKRLKLETLEKCEDVLIKLQEKLKGCFGPGSKSSGNIDNGESSQGCSSSASQVQPVVEKPSAPESESKNVPFLGDSDYKSTSSLGIGKSIFPSKSHDERSKAETASCLETNLDSRNKGLYKSDATVNFPKSTSFSESVRPKEIIPCLESPSSPTQADAVTATNPVRIPLERKEPLSAFQESRERLKKIMTTQQPPSPLTRRRDSFTQPSFTVQQARTPTPELFTCARDNPPSTPVRPFNPPPPPPLGNTESRPDLPLPLPSPAHTPDRIGTPARPDIDPDFPFLKKNESYLPVNLDPEFPYLKKTESFIQPVSSSTPANNRDVPNRSPGLSLKAKLGQEIDVVHKVGVSTGGALRTLISKEDRKSIEKKDDEAEKEKSGDKQTAIDFEKATKDPRKDPRRSSIESQSSGGNTPSRVDPRRSSVSSSDTAAVDNVGFPHPRGGVHMRNDIGSHSVDNHNVTTVTCSPLEGGKRLPYPPLINDTPRQTQVPPLLTPPIRPAPSPLFPDLQPNQVTYDPYPPVKPDFYGRSQNNQRPRMVCSTTSFPQNRPSTPRFQTPNRVLLPTPSRIVSPWGNPAAGGSVRQTSAHQLGLRYSHRSMGGPNTTEEPRIEPYVVRQGAHQPGKQCDLKNTVTEKDAIPSLFTPDRVRTNPPFEANTPNALHRREAGADVKAGGRKEGAQEKYRSTDIKKRGQDEKHDREREKDRDRNWDGKKSQRKAKDNFTSPLGSLYDNIPPPKTGKGYGIQNFKIPKKKTDPPPENKVPVPLKSPPVTSPSMSSNKAPVNEQRRISPLRDPRTLRGKSRPPSPVNEPQTRDIPVWAVDPPPSFEKVPNVVPSELPFVGPSQPERLPVDNQSRAVPQTFIPKGAPKAFTKSDRKLHDDSGHKSPSSEGSSNFLNRNSRASSRAGSRSPYRGKSQVHSPWPGTSSPERSKSRARSRPRSRTPERSKSRARSRPRSRTPERSKSRARSRLRSQTPERSKSRARSRSRSRTPERAMSRARSRPRSRTPERGMSRARSKPRSRTPERSKSRARSRPRSRTPERSKSRARSRQRSRTPVRSRSRARSRPRSRTPDRSKSRARSKLRSRTPERSRSRGRSRPRSRTPARRKSSRSPEGRKSRARSRNRSKSRARSRSASTSDTRSTDKSIGKSSLVERSNLSAQTKARSRSREKTSSGRSTSQDSNGTNDSDNYSRSTRHQNRSSDRDAKSRSSRSLRKSRSTSRNNRSSEPIRRLSNSRVIRSHRKLSESPSPRRSSRRSSRSRRRRKSRSRSPSRDVETITLIDSEPQQTEVTGDPKSSSTQATKTESDVSSSSDSQPAKVNTVSDADSKEVLPTESAENMAVNSSAQPGKEPSKPGPITNEVEDKLAALKDLLGNADLMKLLVEKNIINLSAVGNISSVQSVTGSNQTVESDSSNIVSPAIATPSVIETLNAKTADVSKHLKTLSTPEAPTTAAVSETPKIATVPEVLSAAAVPEVENTSVLPETPGPVAEGGVPNIVDIAENSQTSADILPTASSVDETSPLPQQVKRPTRRSRKKLTAKKTKAVRATASAPEETSLVERHTEPGEKQPQPPQPRRRGKNELERLQEDIREMFISAEVVTATGQRTCRVRREAQEQGAKSRNSSSDKSRTESDIDSQCRSRNREEESYKTLNTSSDSNRSEGTAETGTPAEDSQDGANSDDDDTPLNVIQRTLDVRSPTVSESSPIRAASKKRKYNLIDSETESEVENVEEGRVSSCSVVIENIAQMSLGKDTLIQRAPSRNMARRGRRLNIPNFGNRKVPLEELPPPVVKEDPKLPEVEEECAESVKSLIDCNNIINWPDGEEHGKLTRRQLKMRLTEQDVELSKATASDDAAVPSDNTTCNEGTTSSANMAEAPLGSKAVTSSVNSEVMLSSSKSAASDQASPNKSGATASPAKTVPTASTTSSIASDKTPAENLKTDLKEKDKSDESLPITLIKSEPVSFDDSGSRTVLQGLRAESAGNEFVYSNNFVKCRYCSWRGKAVIAHYKCAHPDEEVDYARFPSDMASKLYADSEREGYNTMTIEDINAKFPKKKQRHSLRCVLCRCVSSSLRFPKHFSLHTGEYHYRCASCTFTATSKDPIREHFTATHEGKRAHIEHVVHGNVRPLNIALAYSCSLCNFFQLQKQSIEKHIMMVHPNAKDCVPMCVSVSELIDTAAAKNTVVGTPTEDAVKETESLEDMPVLTREDIDLNTRENLSSVPQAQVENTEGALVAPSVPDSTAAKHQELPAASDSSSLPSANSNKAIDLSVFISSETLESQEQQIEEERLKKLKDAEESLPNRPVKPRMSILDRIAERINAPLDIAAAPTDTSPLVSLRATAARRANKSLQSMNQALDGGSGEQKMDRQPPAKSQNMVDENLGLEPASNALSAGELISTVELMRKKIETPILARNKAAATVHLLRNTSVVNESITVATVFRMQDPNLASVRVGDVEVRQGLMNDLEEEDAGSDKSRKPKDLLYVCHGDNCIFTSSLPKLYVDHLASDHHRWRVRQMCSVCRHDLEEPGDMVYAFNHIRTQHLIQEYPDPVQRQSPQKPQPVPRPKFPLLRARRIPGDKLSGPIKHLDAESIPQPEAPAAEDESAPFCIIENVVSLSSVPATAKDENVDVGTVAEEQTNMAATSSTEPRPVPPAAPLSPQALSALSVSSLEKTPDSRNRSADELTPTNIPQVIPVPVSTPRPTTGRVSFQKTTAVATAMLSKEKLRHFFKCTGRRCSYTTNLKTNFVYHYNVHVAKESERANPETQFEWNRCVYCGVEESSGGRLTDHMLQFHGECCYQCAYCLYRAAFQSNVVFHQNVSHTSEVVSVLECRRVAESPPVPTPIQKIKFYKCAQDPDRCKEEFFFTEDFKFHLRLRHSNDSFHCSVCPSEFTSPELLLLHCNVTHFMRTYHCLYCRKAAETQKEMSHHMCYDHPEESISVAARIRLEGHSQSSMIDIGEPPNVQKIQIVRLNDESGDSLEYLVTLPPVTGGFQTEPSEETDDPMQEVLFDNDLAMPRPLTSSEKEVIVLSDEDPGTDLEQSHRQLRMALLGSTAPYRIACVTKSSEPPPLVPLAPLPPRVQVEPQPSTSEPVRSEDRVLTANEVVAKTMKEIENTGLVGRALYRCGHTDCSYTAENMTQLKDHMFVCDFSRLSPALVCVHCSRVSKTVESFVEHLRSHGLHRYKCSLCDGREPTYHLIFNHMKKKHYFTEIDTVPVHPLQKDPDESLFTVYAKDVATGKRRTKKANKPVYYSGKSPSSSSDTSYVSDKSAFTPQEIHLLPRSAVFHKELRCALCNYSNKVRCNLVRHLQHHAEGRVASPTPVVNPVPHLERNNGEKMFDTMTNHAVSSNLAQRRDSTTSAKELEELPIFVAEQARYACSVCRSVTSEDTLHLHLTALHPELKETGYECPHCRDRPIGPIPLDRIAHHLKMHDSTLYKCPYCNFHHYHRHYVHRHTQDKHPDQPLYTKVVREPESKSSSQNASEMSSEQSGPESVDSEPTREHQVVAFQCGMCGFEAPRAKVLNHARLVHKTYASLKCASCEFESNHRKVFSLHFRKTHDGVPQQIIPLLKKVVRSEMVGTSSNPEKRSKEQPTPSWQLQKGHAKHVRGIMFEENGPKPREMEHGDFGEASGTKRSLSSDHKDGPEPKRMFSRMQSSKSASCTKDEPFEKFRCPKCSNFFEMTESQFRIHLLEEAESSTWLCHICSKGSENFFCLVKHYATDHHIYDEMFVMKNGLYDTRVTTFVNGLIAKHYKVKQKKSQAGSLSQDKSRVTRTSRSLASSPVAWTAGQASDSSSDASKKAKLQSTTPIKILSPPSIASPPRLTPSPANILTPGTLKKIMVVKPMSHSGKSADEVDPLVESEDFEINIEEVDEDSRSNEEWERFEKPSDQHCSHCKQNFKSEEQLKLHVASVHGAGSSSDRPFGCSHCDFTCKSKSEKRNHEMRHWLDLPFKCGHCENSFSRELEARKHCLKSHPDKSLVVVKNDVSASKQSILPLVRKRKRKLDVSASPADKSQPSSRASSPEDKDSECPALKGACEEDYKHIFYPSVYKCSYCPRRNTSLRQLEIHWESNHYVEHSASTFKYDEMDFSEIAGYKRPFKFRCGACFKTGFLPVLAEHYKEEHGNIPVALRGLPEKVFQCGLCVCHYKSASCLNRHYDRKHPLELMKFVKTTIDPDAEKRQYQCLWCEETSGTKGQREISESLQALAEHHHRFHCHLDPKYKEINNALIKPSQAEALVSAGNKPSSSGAANWDEPGSSTVRQREESSDVQVRSVAKKSTSKVRSVARKSTSKPSRACVKNVNYMDSYASTSEDSDDDAFVEEREGTSFYGRASSPVDVKRVTCPIQCGPVVRRVNVATAAQASQER